MKKNVLPLLLLFVCLVSSLTVKSQTDLRIIIIRHGEKQQQGENLNCMGLNRSLKLISVLHQKIGVPDYIYVPSLGTGSKTLHSRMFQTITPFAVKYNSSINSQFSGGDFDNIVADLKGKRGTILFVWDHGKIPALAKALGIDEKKLSWSDSDFDSMWVITGKKKDKVLKIDKEGIVPEAGCPVF